MLRIKCKNVNKGRVNIVFMLKNMQRKNDREKFCVHLLFEIVICWYFSFLFCYILSCVKTSGKYWMLRNEYSNQEKFIPLMWLFLNFQWFVFFWTVISVRFLIRKKSSRFRKNTMILEILAIKYLSNEPKSEKHAKWQHFM